MATSSENKNLIENNVKKFLNKESNNNKIPSSIDDNIKLWLEKSKNILNKIWFILHQEDFEKKQTLLSEFNQKNKMNIEFIEYLISSTDAELVSNEFNLLRHNYYNIKNQILEIKNEIVSSKIDKYYEDFSKSHNKLTDLEDNFEGIGSTAITIITSIGVIASSISAIEKISSRYIPLFIVSMVWMGMTFIVFINKLFGKKDKNNKEATILYFIMTFIFLIILYTTCNDVITGILAS